MPRLTTSVLLIAAVLLVTGSCIPCASLAFCTLPKTSEVTCSSNHLNTLQGDLRALLASLLSWSTISKTILCQHSNCYCIAESCVLADLLQTSRSQSCKYSIPCIQVFTVASTPSGTHASWHLTTQAFRTATHLLPSEKTINVALQGPRLHLLRGSCCRPPVSQNTVSVEAPHAQAVTALPVLTKHGLAATSPTSAVSDRLSGTGSADQALQCAHPHLHLTPKVPPHITPCKLLWSSLPLRNDAWDW